MMPTEPSRFEVAELAHTIFLSRGAVHGHDLDDWLEAERQIRDRLAAATERVAVAADAGRVSG